MILIYRFLTILFYPIFIILIYLRKLLKKEDKERFREKIFPNYSFTKKEKNKIIIWFHAASIGEVQSIFPLIQNIGNNKNIKFLITTVTLSSASIVKKKLSEHQNIEHRYFPFDVNFLIRNFLNQWKPNLAIFVDSEVWPNFIFEIKKRKIPLILINGRITKKSFSRWLLVPKFAKKVFSKFDLCLAASQESEGMLKRLNIQNIKYIGNIKLANKIKKNDLINKELETLKEKKVWCAASTHRGEEIICLKTHLNLKKYYNDVITIIIPRHINRSKEIKELCKKYKITAQILSNKDIIKTGNEIIIVNSFGALIKFFTYSKSVFIGKSLIEKLKKESGQNPIEAAKLGCKVYHGPYVYNFQEIYNLLNHHNIAEKIYDDKELSEKLINDFNDTKDKKDNIVDKIDELGEKILINSVKEINKFLI